MLESHRSPQVETLLAKAEPEIKGKLQDIGDFRINGDNLAAMRRQPPGWIKTLPDSVEGTDHVVPGPAGAPDVTLRVYRPKASAGALPCVYAIHGGGYVIGSHRSFEARFGDWCTEIGCVGVSVDYRLAPEVPFPGPLEDCYGGLHWLYENAESLGVDPARIGVMGASAGGGLAAALALLARDREKIPLAFQLLIYPMLDDTQREPSMAVPTPIWGPDNNEYAWRSYLGDAYGTDAVSPYAAPTRAADLAGLPAAMVIVGELDGLLDEDISYARRLISDGVPTDLHVLSGAPHGFDSMLADTDLARRALSIMEAWLRVRLTAAV